jgi:hypothetical protein
MVVSIEELGKCEHCGAVFTMNNMSGDSADSDWACSGCRNKLGPASFGLEEVNGRWQKTRWVGPGGAWVGKKPESSFVLGRLEVETASFRYLY